MYLLQVDKIQPIRRGLKICHYKPRHLPALKFPNKFISKLETKIKMTNELTAGRMRLNCTDRESVILIIREVGIIMVMSESFDRPGGVNHSIPDYLKWRRIDPDPGPLPPSGSPQPQHVLLTSSKSPHERTEPHDCRKESCISD